MPNFVFINEIDENIYECTGSYWITDNTIYPNYEYCLKYNFTSKSCLECDSTQSALYNGICLSII